MGAIASVVGVARLFGLTPQQITEAINLATVANVTLAQTRLGHVSTGTPVLMRTPTAMRYSRPSWRCAA